MPLRGTVCAVRAPVRRWILLVLTLALVTASCGGDDGGDTQQVESSFTPPRTYEDLDLSGPEAAVAEFISAFVRRDYIAAALILHPDAQRTMSACGRRERPHRTRRSERRAGGRGPDDDRARR
jgi:hypothetical protein